MHTACSLAMPSLSALLAMSNAASVATAPPSECPVTRICAAAGLSALQSDSHAVPQTAVRVSMSCTGTLILTAAGTAPCALSCRKLSAECKHLHGALVRLIGQHAGDALQHAVAQAIRRPGAQEARVHSRACARHAVPLAGGRPRAPPDLRSHSSGARRSFDIRDAAQAFLDNVRVPGRAACTGEQSRQTRHTAAHGWREMLRRTERSARMLARLAVPRKLRMSRPGAHPSRHTVSMAGSYSTCKPSGL